MYSLSEMQKLHLDSAWKSFDLSTRLPSRSRTQSRGGTGTETTARIENGEVFPSSRNPYAIRSAELKVVCENYQNLQFLTVPPTAGLIRFLSEIADLLIRKI